VTVNVPLVRVKPVQANINPYTETRTRTRVNVNAALLCAQHLAMPIGPKTGHIHFLWSDNRQSASQHYKQSMQQCYYSNVNCLIRQT